MPLSDKSSKCSAQLLDKIHCSKLGEVLGWNFVPGLCGPEPLFFQFARPFPMESLLELNSVGLFYAKPTKLQLFFVILNIGNPMVLVALRDSVGLREDA